MSELETKKGALEGKLIIDLSRVLGGPYCTQILADHGAEVIKIEPPRGDETRDWGPPYHGEDAAYFIGVNRNKRAMGLDLTKEQGRQVLLQMLEKADVIVENFKPGTMEKWGLSYEGVLQKKFPGLIHCRVSGFGGDGPLGALPGYDAIVQGMTGWFSVNGETDGAPVRLGLAMVDMGTGLYSAVAILLAIAEREKSGLGQYLDMTLYDCALALMHPHIVNYNYSGEIPAATGNAHPNISPYDTFRTKTTDIYIGAGNNGAYAKLCKALDRLDLIEDPRFLNNVDRVKNRVDLKAELESSLVKIDGGELCIQLGNAGLAAGPIHNTAQAVNHPHTLHRNMRVEDDWYKMTGTPIKMSRTPGAMRSKPPTYGQHTRELLKEFGFTEQQSQELLAVEAVLEKRRS